MRNVYLEEKIEDLKQIIKNTNNQYIEYATQIKILKATMQEKVENVKMLDCELGTGRCVVPFSSTEPRNSCFRLPSRSGLSQLYNDTLSGDIKCPLSSRVLVASIVTESLKPIYLGSVSFSRHSESHSFPPILRIWEGTTNST